ncbi:hypothetical protein IMZ08_05895 [Bacillus luteolus]|uniref:Uncharacterized protein n=1 Tax=Litchfieldia luteola TaxID=682179 RepID=A0ABR9QGH8_9BACI|nr:hypothetical protein [Cytobacillus luteolus]MBE4907595.1 hypothetical protein [Cytobacillus luteolus]MBP1944370.1 nitrogen fixation-related uncharacterized protein [Cytobacillus luteolus]
MKKGILFTLGYCLFIVLAAGIGFYYSSESTQEDKLTRQNEVKQAFNEALKAEEERIEKKKESEDSDKWTPSPGFMLTAISIGAIADIVIVILWARHENRKRELEAGTNLTRKKRLTDSNLFWWVIGLGIVRKRNDKLIVDWKYVVGYLILGLLLKVWLTNELF